MKPLVLGATVGTCGSQGWEGTAPLHNSVWDFQMSAFNPWGAA